MEKLEKVFKYFDFSPEADFEGKKTERMVLFAEEKLGFNFPYSYRKFLRQYGCGDVAGREIFGIINYKFAECVPDAAGFTAMQRREHNLPNQYVLIAEDDEWFYAIDSSCKTAEGENPVVKLCVGDFSKCEPVADTFEDYLFDLFAEEIEEMEKIEIEKEEAKKENEEVPATVKENIIGKVFALFKMLFKRKNAEE